MGGDKPALPQSEIELESEEGDLFWADIEKVVHDHHFIVVGEDWNLWGKWIYAKDIGLIGLLSRPYRAKEWTGAFAMKKGYEWIISALSR